MKREFKTAKSLIKNLNLLGVTELTESAERLGITLEQYVESILYEDKTGSYWIGIDLAEEGKDFTTYGKEGVNTTL